MKYFIKSNDKLQGPMTADQIRLRLAEGAYHVDDFVRREDTEDWQQIRFTREFLEALGFTATRKNSAANFCISISIFSALLMFLAVLDRNLLLLLLSFAFDVIAIFAGVRSWLKIRDSFIPIPGGSITKLGLSIAILIPITPFFSAPFFDSTSERAGLVSGINNCRQIVTSLKIYASDNSGSYPDVSNREFLSSNEVFHELFTSGVLTTESIFGSPESSFRPDSNIGEKPDFIEAVKPSENHWAMTKGLSDSSPSSLPLIFENPAETTWPPRWNAFSVTRPVPGRAWSGGKVIVGMNDGTVSARKLTARVGKNLELTPDAEGKPIFPPTPKYEILNVAK
jgi:hypothetical protein